jgi:hypothetical protein
LGAVDNLCLDSIQPSTQDLLSGLSASESKNFTNAVKNLETAKSKLLQAKREKGDLAFQVSSFATAACNNTIVIVSSFTSPLSMIGCYAAVTHYDANARNIAKLSREAMEYANKGANDLIEYIGKDADDLYCVGGGYANFSSASSSFYARIRDFLRFSRLQTQLDLSPDSSDSDTGKRWSIISNKMWSYYENVQNSPATVSNCEYASILNQIIGDNGVLPLLVDFHRQLLQSKERTLDVFERERSEVEVLLRDAERENEYFKKEEYSKITAYFLIMFLEYNSSTSVDELLVPSLQVKTFISEVYGDGFTQGAKDIFSRAISIFQGKDDFYVSKAIEQIKTAKSRLNESLEKTVEMKSTVERIKETAKDSSEAKKNSAEETIRSFVPNSSAEVDLLTSSRSEFDEAINLMEKASYASTGQAIIDYKHANDRFEDSIRMLGDPSQLAARGESDANASIVLLEKTINAAQSDEIDVTVERGILGNLRALFSVGLDSGHFSTIKAAADNAVLTLLGRAADQYRPLKNQRARIMQTLQLVSEFYDTSEIKARFVQFDRYIVGDEFDPVQTLGKYRTIKTTYGQVDQELSGKMRDSLTSYLSSNVKVSKFLSSIPVADELIWVLTTIVVRNDLPFSLNETLPIPVSGVNLDASSNVSLPKNVRIIPTDKGLTLSFLGIVQNSLYLINISSSQKLIETTDRI